MAASGSQIISDQDRQEELGERRFVFFIIQAGAFSAIIWTGDNLIPIISHKPGYLPFAVKVILQFLSTWALVAAWMHLAKYPRKSSKLGQKTD